MKNGERAKYGPVFGTVQSQAAQGRVILLTDGGNEIEVFAEPLRTERDFALAAMSARAAYNAGTFQDVYELIPVEAVEPEAVKPEAVESPAFFEPEPVFASAVVSRIIWPQ